jgi:nitrite reductase/ring-hydroxylating ferredoxin subunit
MNNRRSFLKTACKPIVLAAFGVPLLESCSTEDETFSYGANQDNNTIVPRKPVIIDISKNTFSTLQDVGGWLNYLEENILLVRISEEEIRVFNNSCPHQGNRDKWSYSGGVFECGYHNNTYSDNCTGSLTCYDASLDDNILTINF